MACSKKNQVYNYNPSKRRPRFLQSVSIRGKVYRSLRDAALATGESRTNISRNCKNSNIENYFFLEQVVYDAKEHAKRDCKPVVIHGVFYSGIAKAARALKRSSETLNLWCSDKQVLDCWYVKENNGSND